MISSERRANARAFPAVCDKSATPLPPHQRWLCERCGGARQGLLVLGGLLLAVPAAIHAQPLHQPARTFTRHGSLRAIQRRGASNGGRSLFSPHCSINPGTDGFAGEQHAPRRLRRSGAAVCWLLYIDGFYTSISAGNLLATLVDYKRRFSQIDVCLKESSRVRLVTALRNGALDIAIVTSELPLLADQGMPLWSERILLALLEGHPLAGREVLYWTDLRGETVLLSQYDPGRELEDLLMSKLVSPEDRPKIARGARDRRVLLQG